MSDLNAEQRLQFFIAYLALADTDRACSFPTNSAAFDLIPSTSRSLDDVVTFRVRLVEDVSLLVRARLPREGSPVRIFDAAKQTSDAVGETLRYRGAIADDLDALNAAAKREAVEISSIDPDGVFVEAEVRPDLREPKAYVLSYCKVGSSVAERHDVEDADEIFGLMRATR